ncbi:thiol reductant ABC exporter subunit CydD [Daeguia caeni]|uniref:Thiol reductant ABC exporter subunit CydD n=1 Tax=Daeguia caeni TaxID=439612 RepID=A0ABV9H2Q8_9HYPH
MNSVAPQTERQLTANDEEKRDHKRAHQRKHRAVPAPLRAGAMLQTLAALLWLPQAAFLAFAIGRLANHGFDQSIYLYAAAIFLIGVLRSLIERKGAALCFDAARSELTQLRQKAITALAMRSPLDATRPSSGEAASILAEQAEMVVPYLSRFVPVKMRVMLVPLIIAAVVFYYSWVASLVLFIAAPLIPVFMALIGWRAQAASERQLAAVGGMNGFLLDRLRGLATIRSFGAVDATAIRLRENAETLRRRTMAVLKIAFLSSAVLELFSALGVAMVAVYIGFHLLGQLQFGAWGAKLDLGEALFILLLAPAFFEPLRDLSTVWHDRASGEAGIAALENLAKHSASIIAPAAGSSASDAAPDVTFANVTFRFGEGNAVFSDFSLHVEAGEHVALLAPSAYGKSTLLALAAGLIAPERGAVLIAGHALGDDHAARERMVWIGQKPHIFSGSARFNITLGRKAAAKQVEETAEHMALGHVKGVTDNGLIGESGTGISGGEAMRLALARGAINEKADIILADEPTAHLDQWTAGQITDSLLKFAEGKTLIVATHDEGLAQRMNRVIRLDRLEKGQNLTGRAAE